MTSVAALVEQRNPSRNDATVNTGVMVVRSHACHRCEPGRASDSNLQRVIIAASFSSNRAAPSMASLAAEAKVVHHWSMQLSRKSTSPWMW
jgi:hypothetical protein